MSCSWFFLLFKSIILVALSPVADPDLQIRGGGGGGRARSSKPGDKVGGGTGGLKKIVSAPQFGLKIRGGVGPRGPFPRSVTAYYALVINV